MIESKAVQTYGANDIQTLEFREAIRTKVSMYLGENGNQGVLQGIREIITNSIDEFIMGYGNRVIVELFENNRIRILDYGRSIPFGSRADGSEAMEAAILMPHSGGKFDQKVYQSVGGTHGVGLSAVALSSDFFEARCRRGGQMAVLTLEKGKKISFEVQSIDDKLSGTMIEYVPSQEVFHLEPISIEFDKVKKMCKEAAYLNKGLLFSLTNHVTGESVEYCSKNGILDMMGEIVNNPVHSTPIYYTLADEEGSIVEVACQWSKGHEVGYVFTNGLHNPQGGTPLTGIRTSITRNINKMCKEGLGGEIARRGAIYIINCKVKAPSFSDQTKGKVNNPGLRTLADRAFSEGLEAFRIQYPKELESILTFIAKEKKADVAAERARAAILNATQEITATQKKKVFSSDKLQDAIKLGQSSILILTEGDSAASRIRTARDPKSYGILALRGKIINALTNPLDKVLENEEVRLIISALGLTLNKYDAKRLRYGKIAIACDSDADGGSISNLVVTLFYVLFPEVLKEGRLYKFYSPLYKVTKGKSVSYYYSEEEMRKGDSGTLKERFKGLGSLDIEDAKEVFFNPKTRRLEQLIWDEEAAGTIEALLGEDVGPRKDFVFTEIDFSEYMEDL